MSRARSTIRPGQALMALSALGLIVAIPCLLVWGFGVDRFGLIALYAGGGGIVLGLVGSAVELIQGGSPDDR